jgi:hypothetical protein
MMDIRGRGERRGSGQRDGAGGEKKSGELTHVCFLWVGFKHAGKFNGGIALRKMPKL